MNDVFSHALPVDSAAPPDFSSLAIHLLKGVIYRDADERQWGTLLDLQARVRDYMAILGLELVLDEAEVMLSSRAGRIRARTKPRRGCLVWSRAGRCRSR